MMYDRDKCERLSKHGLAATCRECMNGAPGDAVGQYWCRYCVTHTNNMTRIEEKPVTVSWTIKETVCIGHHNCDNCGIETPAPSMDALLAWVQANPGSSTMWPGGGCDPWQPPGWIQVDDKEICSNCAAVVADALQWAAVKSTPGVTPELCRECRAELLFSARASGRGLCGPCQRLQDDQS